MKTRTPYPTDLNDQQWQILQPLLPQAKPGGRPETYPKRDILNGIFYVVRGGIAWRALPHDLPPYGIVYHYFRQWRLDGTWSHLNDVLHGDVRVLEGRHRQPTAASIDSQSVKMTDRGGDKGFDGAKWIKGPEITRIPYAPRRPAQQTWIAALAGCPGVEAHVWRPADWPAIVERLQSGNCRYIVAQGDMWRHETRQSR